MLTTTFLFPFTCWSFLPTIILINISKGFSKTIIACFILLYFLSMMTQFSWTSFPYNDGFNVFMSIPTQAVMVSYHSLEVVLHTMHWTKPLSTLVRNICYGFFTK